MDKLQFENSLENLKQIQSWLDDFEAMHFKERKKLEKEYREKFQPVYTRRYEIVKGDSKVIKSSNESADQGKDKPAEESGVPDFWLTAMKSNDVMAEMIQKHDEDALRYLKDIKWRRIDLPKNEYPQAKATGFMFEFFFDPNPYFENPVLTKTYYVLDEDIDILVKAIGTEIRWFPRKCLTNKVLIKNTSSVGKIRTTLNSFFNFFNPLELPDFDDVDDGDIDEMVESVIFLMQQDYNVGVTLKEFVIPHALFCFTEGDFDIESGDSVDITYSHKNAKAKKFSDIVLRNVKLLKEIQDEHDALEGLFFDARRELDVKYLKRCQPLFRKRCRIVNGIKPAVQGEIKSGKDKGVPNFWLTALKANVAVAKLIHKQDEEVLKYLNDITWHKLRDPNDDPNCCIVIEFCFCENPFFSNSVLTKSYFVDEDYPFCSSLENTIGTEIEWFSGKCLIDSFFDFFAPPELPDDEQIEEWRSLMKPDYNVGLKICKDVIPHAVSLFATAEFEDCVEDDDEFGDDNKST